MEVEGSVLIASALLGRSDASRDRNTRNLLVGAHEQVRANIANTIEQFGALFKSGQPINRVGPGWDAFPPLRELRNRLTHPHFAHDLLVDSDSFDIALAFASWWHQEVHSCLDEVILKHSKSEQQS
jgi:hypothetical protein